MAVFGWDPPKDSGNSGGNSSNRAPGQKYNGNNTTASVWMPKWQSEIFVNTSTPQGISGASDYNSATYNTEIPKSQAEALWTNNDAPGQGYMTKDVHDWVTGVAKSIDYRKTGASLWREAVASSESLWSNHGIRKSPLAIISEWAAGGAPGSGGGGGGGGFRHGGGGGGGVGPTAAGPDEVRRAMDQVSSALIGRTLSDKEFDLYYGQYKGAFAGNPRMDAQQHMIEAARKDGDYEEYQVATKFSGALDKVLRGAA